MNKKLICIALLPGSFISACAFGSPVYSRLAVLGGSRSDTGNNAVLFDRFLGGARTSVLSLPPELVPSSSHQSDRYSKGPVWVEPFVDAFGVNGRALPLGGTNYAYGGVRVGLAGTAIA